MNGISRRLVLVSFLASACIPLSTEPGDDARVPEIIVDGIMSDGEWEPATVFHFDANVPDGGTTPASIYLTNDAVDLFVAVRFQRTLVDPGNSVGVEFDTDGSNTLSVWDDGFVVNPDLGALSDVVRVTSEQYPRCPPGALCGPRDEGLGGTNDGAWSFANDGSFTVYEASHPLNSGDVYDFALTSGDVIGFQLFLRTIGPNASYPEGFGDTRFPAVGFQPVKIR